MRIQLAAAVVLAMTIGCGGDDGGTGGPDAPPGTPDSPVGMVVPDPGTGTIPFSWPDTEPNDTAAQAVPLGTSTAAGEATWFDGTAQSGSLGAADHADFFVFRSSPQGGNFHNGPCWDQTAAPNLMDFYVYKVTAGAVGPMVGSSATTDPACENIGGAADVAMDPDTVYLVEMRATTAAPSAIYAA